MAEDVLNAGLCEVFGGVMFLLVEFGEFGNIPHKLQTMLFRTELKNHILAFNLGDITHFEVE